MKGTKEGVSFLFRQKAPRLLLVRLSALGDTLMSTPVAHALREAFPKAYLGWVVEERCAPVVKGNPFLNRVHVWDKTPSGLLRLIREIRKEGYQGALDLQGLLKSALIPWLSGIPVRIGFADGREGSPRFLTYRLPPPPPAPFVSGRNFRLLQALNIPFDPHRHRLLFPLTEKDRYLADDRLAAFRLTPKRFLVLAPATTRPQKHWRPERWSELAKRIKEDLSLTPVLMGGRSDAALLYTIARGCPFPIPLIADLPLKGAVAVIERAAALVGPDSFPIHAALAVGTPAVALFGPNLPFRFREEEGIAILEHPLGCRPCGRRPTCQGLFTCMRLITVNEVLGALTRLLNRSPSS